MSFENRLSKEKSPYLLQHKNNPVDWYPWGEEAFQKARTENKLIFLSIGYSTCHWCHVMEHDSFEKQEVADVLNRHYVSIKVDREERPDIDHLYMDAVMAMTGSGGWPLSSFLTPDLKPFFGGTFFWKDQFIELLKRVNHAWQEQPEKLKESGKELAIHMQGMSKKGEGIVSLDDSILQEAFQLYHQTFDDVFGGFGNAPKFPRSTDLSLLLRIYRRSGKKEALDMVEKMLDQMARGGMYDHLGGGFHRYSTDARWLVPHFEKMLYDNALLSWTYLEAYQVTGKEMYAEVSREVLNYVLRDMEAPTGGFYSAEDADSEGEEGKFYVWTEAELKSLLTPTEFEKISAVYAVTSAGNFEHQTNIFHLDPDADWSVKKDPLIVSAHQKLFEVRKKRIHPYKDDKVLTSWNGLMIQAFAKGYQVLGDKRYLQAAQNAALFIQKYLYQAEKLLRRYRDGEARFSGFLEDYAFLIHGLLELYQSDFNPDWIEWAEKLQNKQDELFWDKKEGGYFFSEVNSTDLFVRKKESYDGATPSGNSVSALNLLRLYGFTLNREHDKKAEATFGFISKDVERYPPGYSMALCALDYKLDLAVEVAVIGKKEDPATQDILRFLQKNFLPNKVMAFLDTAQPTKYLPKILEGRKILKDNTTVYVCEKNVCKAPTDNMGEAKKIILQ